MLPKVCERRKIDICRQQQQSFLGRLFIEFQVHRPSEREGDRQAEMRVEEKVHADGTCGVGR